MALIHLIYTSAIADPSMEGQIDKILETSVRRNRDTGITGMLLYCNGSFMQVLEGEEDAVVETFNRICKDTRHYDIIEIIRNHISKRDFSEWSMGFRLLSPEYMAGFPKYAQFFKLSPAQDSINAEPGVALELLQQFSIDNR